MVNMVELARTKDERDAEKKAGTGNAADPGSYDDTVHVHLADHHLKKLGLHGNVEAGHEIHIHARGKVSHSSTDKEVGDKKTKRLTLQLTHMGVADKPDHEDTRDEIRSDIEKATRGERDKY